MKLQACPGHSLTIWAHLAVFKWWYEANITSIADGNNELLDPSSALHATCTVQMTRVIQFKQVRSNMPNLTRRNTMQAP